jgi:hypothetical protein
MGLEEPTRHEDYEFSCRRQEPEKSLHSATTLLERTNAGMPMQESESGASELENLHQEVPTPGLRDNHPRSVSQPPRRENGSLPHNVTSTGNA